MIVCMKELSMGIISSSIGFYGQWNMIDPFPSVSSWWLGKPEHSLAGQNGAIQWLSPPGERESLPDRRVFLAGLVWQPENTPQSIAGSITESIKRGRYHELASFDNAAGCLLSTEEIYLWVGFASKDAVFFRTDGPQVRWSTNPLDLVEAAKDLNLWALRRCCHGDDVCVYPFLQRVEQGHLVIIHKDRSLSTHQFDQFCPATTLCGTMKLDDFLHPTRTALRQAVQPLSSESKVGLLLSGGAGSVALLAALKEAGINTIAYHLESPDPAGSEYSFARLACEALGVPLKNITMDIEASYLSQSWMFSHPYAHPWARWYEQAAQLAQDDHIRLLVTGGGDDNAFGPLLTYGLHSLFSPQVAWREKIRMVRAMLSTDWNVWNILGSLLPHRQLIGPSSLVGIRAEDREMRRADFLTPIPLRPRAMDDIALRRAPCFSPQAMSLNHALLQPRGIALYNPYHQRVVQEVALALPDAYKLIPNLFPHLAPTERMIDKPVLRLAFDGMPAETMWRGWSVWTQAAGQQFCLRHQEILRLLLSTDSHLAALGVTDPARLEQVLQSRPLIRENYKTLVTSAMVELFLAGAWYPQIKRGGPLWK
jgi:hypothetical protein